jgi:hypothetical protein
MKSKFPFGVGMLVCVIVFYLFVINFHSSSGHVYFCRSLVGSQWGPRTEFLLAPRGPEQVGWSFGLGSFVLSYSYGTNVNTNSGSADLFSPAVTKP